MDTEIQTADNKPLKPTQIAFIDAYTALGQTTFQNISKSGVKAGFTPNSAYKSGKRLLENPKIAQEVAKRLDQQHLEAQNAASMTKDELTKISKEFLKECGAKHPNTPRYLDLICKTNGLYVETPSNQILVYNAKENENPESSNLKSRLQRLFKTLGKE